MAVVCGLLRLAPRGGISVPDAFVDSDESFLVLVVERGSRLFKFEVRYLSHALMLAPISSTCNRFVLLKE